MEFIELLEKTFTGDDYSLVTEAESSSLYYGNLPFITNIQTARTEETETVSLAGTLTELLCRLVSVEDLPIIHSIVSSFFGEIEVTQLTLRGTSEGHASVQALFKGTVFSISLPALYFWLQAQSHRNAEHALSVATVLSRGGLFLTTIDPCLIKLVKGKLTTVSFCFDYIEGDRSLTLIEDGTVKSLLRIDSSSKSNITVIYNLFSRVVLESLGDSLWGMGIMPVLLTDKRLKESSIMFKVVLGNGSINSVYLNSPI